MKAFIIIQGSGQWSDRCARPVRVYLDQAKAQAVMATLDGVSEKYEDLLERLPQGESFSKAFDELNTKAAAEYQLLGFDAHAEHDWELSEAELDET